jgi:hypothetical protein
MVLPLPECVDRVQFLLRSVPEHLIHSWGVFALVFRHSSHGKRFAAKRMGQQTLQGFHLAPSAFLSCLDDTGLKPTHSLVGFLPVDG